MTRKGVWTLPLALRLLLLEVRAGADRREPTALSFSCCSSPACLRERAYRYGGAGPRHPEQGVLWEHQHQALSSPGVGRDLDRQDLQRQKILGRSLCLSHWQKGTSDMVLPPGSRSQSDHAAQHTSALVPGPSKATTLP